MKIEELVTKKTFEVGPGLETEWIWPIKDDAAPDGGSWLGPTLNWEAAHKSQYFEFLKGRNNVVVTAGANCGLHTRYYASFFKTVYAFEPDWLNFYCLCRNCPEENVIKFMACLGETHKLVNLNNTSMNTGAYTVDPNNSGRIPCVTVDSLQLTECDLIQLDVEGYEDRVLQGAYNTIVKCKPVIALETVHSSTLEMLTSIGYIMSPQSIHDRIFYCE